MVKKEILLMVEALSNEKDLDKETIFHAIETALAAATIKRHEDRIDARVAIDRKTGDHATFRRWTVVERNDEFPDGVESPDLEMLLEAARVIDPAAEVGGAVEQPMESIEFGRIAAQTAKQVLMQKVREAEYAKVADLYRDRVGELVRGTVRRAERGNVYLDLGNNATAIIPREEMIHREPVHLGDHLRGYLKAVQTETRGPMLLVSRTAPEFLTALFRLEVPEISEGVIEIMGAARDPGVRAKIAVRTHDTRLDPVGACIGMRGARVQAVTNELAGERVDIILWNENEAQYVINAMSPAEIVSIVVDEDTHSMDIAVADDNLSLAIGRGGQNVRLASELTGWELNVIGATQALEKSATETQSVREAFARDLGVDEDIAAILVREGFTTVEELAYIPPKDLMNIEEFDQELVDELRNRAKDALLIKAIAGEENIDSATETAGLMDIEGMDEDLLLKLEKIGVRTMEDLAEQSVDDLMEVDGMDETRAGQLIMAARAPWFAEQN